MTEEEKAREAAIIEYQKTLSARSAKEVIKIAKESILRLGFYSRPMEDGLDRVRLTAAVRHMRANYLMDFPFPVEAMDGKASNGQLLTWEQAARFWISRSPYPETMIHRFMEWIAEILRAEINHRDLLENT